MTVKPETILEMVGVSKRYPGTLAVNSVDFDLKAGEVHALMGENGAGKSTVLKAISNILDLEDGEITEETYNSRAHG